MFKKVILLTIALSFVTMFTIACDRTISDDNSINSTPESSYYNNEKDNILNVVEATDNNPKLESNAGETKPVKETQSKDSNESEPFCAPPNYKIYSRDQILNHKNNKNSKNEAVLNRLTDDGLSIPKEIAGFETLYIELVENSSSIEESYSSIEQKNDKYRDAFYCAYLRSYGCTHDAEYYTIDHEECDLITFTFRNNYEKYGTFGEFLDIIRNKDEVKKVNSKGRDIYYKIYDDPIGGKNNEVKMEWMEGPLYVRVYCSKEVLEKVGFDNLVVEKVELK